MAAINRAEIVDGNFRDRVLTLPSPTARRTDLDAPVRTGAQLTARQAIALFCAQLGSRHLDLAARAMRVTNESFYTIGSSGHEGNAAIAAALRPTDPAFLHYRSGGFYLARAQQVPTGPDGTPIDGIADVARGLVASCLEPISGGRHKVFGRKELAIPPQTSTIASHLPKAVGAAVALDRMRRLGLPTEAPADGIVLCSFGDASINHATATTAVNSAIWASYRHIPVPVLFVCEDNGIGISVSTPAGWIDAQYGRRPGLRYANADGRDLADTFDVASRLAAYVRETRRPALLRMSCVRLLGHAGSDVELGYRSETQVESVEAQDPLIATAALLVGGGWMSPGEAVALYEAVRGEVVVRTAAASAEPKLTSGAVVVEPLAPNRAEVVAAQVGAGVAGAERERFWVGPGSPPGSKIPEADRPRHMAVLINRALGDALVQYPGAMIFGEDVGSKGGVYHLTAELKQRAGTGRVFDTLLDETSILGLALGVGQMGGLPIPEIQYLAYLHNAIDQLRGEAGSLQFFSNGQFRNPMVARIASFAYQKGFGGHFHNEHAVGSLRDIPGLRIAAPSNGLDAVRMLRTCLAAAHVDGAVCAFLEPIALYMTRDLHNEGDLLWNSAYPAPGPTDLHLPMGRAQTYDGPTSTRLDPEGRTLDPLTGLPPAPAIKAVLGAPTPGDPRTAGDVTIISYANGLRMSLRVAKRLFDADGLRARVVDLRWIAPLPSADLLREANATGRVLIADETRRSGGLGEGITTALVEAGYRGQIHRVASMDTYIPLGPAADTVLMQEADIERGVQELMARELPASTQAVRRLGGE